MICDKNQVSSEGGDIISDKLSDVGGIRRWQLIGCSEEQSIKLHNLVKEYSKKIPNISIGEATLKLMAAMPELFVSARDVDAFLNCVSQSIQSNTNIPELKKRIKYCRNPMEKKKLQQELNAAYKAVRRRRK